MLSGVGALQPTANSNNATTTQSSFFIAFITFPIVTYTYGHRILSLVVHVICNVTFLKQAIKSVFIIPSSFNKVNILKFCNYPQKQNPLRKDCSSLKGKFNVKLSFNNYRKQYQIVITGIFNTML